METNIKVIGFSNKRINGKTLDNKGFDLDYDGKYLDVNAFDNDRQYYTRLDNEDIMDLLNVPSSQMPLEQRIMQFNVSRHAPMIKDRRIMSNMPLLMPRERAIYHEPFHQPNQPNQIIMYYKPKNKPNSGYKTRHLYRNISKPRVKSMRKYKPNRLSRLSFTQKPNSSQNKKTRKLTYARVSTIKPSSRLSRHSRQSRHSKKSKPVSSIRQTIY